MRQLLWMAEGQGRERWAHTSLVCALLTNAHRDPKRGRTLKPSDFDPYARRERRQRQVADTESLAILREALEARKGGAHGR